MPHSYDAIVVGAGFAGAVAARELRAAGLTTLVLEARNRVGGRAYHRKFTGADAHIEMGGHSYLPRHHNMVREMARYGLGPLHRPKPQRYAWSLGNSRITEAFPISMEEGGDAARVLTLIREASFRVMPNVPHDHQPIRDLDVSFGEFIDRMQPSPVTRDLLLSWAALYTGTDSDASSVLWHLHSIAMHGHNPVALAPAIKIASGTQSLVTAIIEDADADVRLSTPVGRIAQDHHSVTVTSVDGQEFNAARAVVALPVNVWAEIDFTPQLNEGKRAMSVERHSGQCVKVYALVENLPKPVLAAGWGVGNMTWFSTDQLIPEGNLLLGFGYPMPGFDPTKIADVQSALDAYIKGARVVAVDSHDWAGDPFSRGTWMTPRPGQLTRYMSSLSATEGRLHFAGADISTGWFTAMEGALETGKQAAHDLCARFRSEKVSAQ